MWRARSASRSRWSRSASRIRSCRCCRSSDLFLLPSAQESFGLAALEAMACEVPVVASRVGGLHEVIDDGSTGFLHAPGDLEGMARSGVALLTDGDLHARVAAAARRSVLEPLLPRHGRAAVRSLLRAGHRTILNVPRATCHVLRAPHSPRGHRPAPVDAGHSLRKRCGASRCGSRKTLRRPATGRAVLNGGAPRSMDAKPE